MFQPGQNVIRTDIQNSPVNQITKRHVLHTADGMLRHCYALDNYGDRNIFDGNLLAEAELRVGDLKSLGGTGVAKVLAIVEKSDGQKVVVFEVQDNHSGILTLPYRAASLAAYAKAEG